MLASPTRCISAILTIRTATFRACCASRSTSGCTRRSAPNRASTMFTTKETAASRRHRPPTSGLRQRRRRGRFGPEASSLGISRPGIGRRLATSCAGAPGSGCIRLQRLRLFLARRCCRLFRSPPCSSPSAYFLSCSRSAARCASPTCCASRSAHGWRGRHGWPSSSFRLPRSRSGSICVPCSSRPPLPACCSCFRKR